MLDLKPVIFQKKEEVPPGATIIEAFEGAIRELFYVENPKYKGKKTPEVELEISSFLEKFAKKDSWIYYPAVKAAVHTVNEDLYFKLRTTRNRNIITAEEQKKYRDVKVGVAGLSVGSAAISALVMSGGPKVIKISDFDVIEISNLNRIKASLLDVGKNKISVAAEGIWALDPFAELHLYSEGINRENIKDFILGEPKLDIMVDEMDSLDIKVLIRFICKENKIPVLMATDNGDGVILDIERFDLEPDREIFHGLIGNIHEEELNNLDFRKWLSLATKIVGPEYLTERMQDSLLEIGKSVSAVPQLGPTASLAGAAIAFSVRQIANKSDLPSGRYLFGLEEELIPKYNEPDSVEKRKMKANQFKETFGK